MPSATCRSDNIRCNDRAYNQLGFSIHNYFFAKALDQVRPGGIVAFVTSRYTMDSKDDRARKYIAERAELLGAIRLPNNAFKANAGTDVVSDILFLQKRENARASQSRSGRSSVKMQTVFPSTTTLSTTRR